MKITMRIVSVKIFMILMTYTLTAYTQGFPDLPKKNTSFAYKYIDTTDIPLLIKQSDTINHWLHPEICFFLVQNNIPNMAQKLKAGILQGLNKHKENCDWYIAGLFQLQDPEIMQYTNLLLDSIVMQKQKGIYWDANFITRLISVTCYYGDHSRYQLLVDILNSQTVKHSYNLEQLEAYAIYPSMKAKVFDDLKKFAFQENAEYREGAIHAMRSFKDYPGQKELLRDAAMNDNSFGVRFEGIYRLYHQYKDLFVLDAFKKIISEAAAKKDTSNFRRAMYQLEDVTSPYVIITLSELLHQLPVGLFYNEMELTIKLYKPEPPDHETSTLDLLDSLISYTQQCYQIQYIGDKNIVNELSNQIANAKNHLRSSDSVNCSKEVSVLQAKVNKEYEKTIDNEKKNKPRDKRFVTVEGWKFLFYNAQYIIDRLPGKEKKR